MACFRHYGIVRASASRLERQYALARFVWTISCAGSTGSQTNRWYNNNSHRVPFIPSRKRASFERVQTTKGIRNLAYASGEFEVHFCLAHGLDLQFLALDPESFMPQFH